MKKLLLLTIAALLQMPCFAQNDKTLAIQNSNETQKAQLLESNRLLAQEILELKIQNKVIKEYHSSLLDTVYYALGGIGGVALLLVGVNLYSSMRLRTADKEQLSQEFSSKSSAMETKMGAALAQMQSETLKSVDGRVDALLGRMSADLLGLRTELATDKADFQKSVSELQTSTSRQVTVAERLGKAIRNTEAEIRAVEEILWDSRDVPANILHTQAQGLESAIAADNRFFIDGVLDRMKETILKKLQPIDGSAKMGQDTMDRVLEALKAAEKLGGIKVKEVRELLLKTPTYSD